jgi:hypothetical protein
VQQGGGEFLQLELLVLTWLLLRLWLVMLERECQEAAMMVLQGKDPL